MGSRGDHPQRVGVWSWASLARVRIALLVVATLPLSFTATAEPLARVLFIGSYDATFPTFEHQRVGLVETLVPAGCRLDIELMDSKRFNTQENLQNFRSGLAYKLERSPPYDVIIAGDDNATRFVWEERDALFDGAPIVFFGVNDRRFAEWLDGQPGVTGVVEHVSMRETLELISTLHPDVDTVVAISDGTPTGLADLATYQGLQSELPNLTFSSLSLTELSFEALGDALGRLDDEAVLLISAYKDAEGHTVRFDEALTIITERLDRPLYHLWFHGVGDGVLGGVLVNLERQAREAAQMALRIVGGTRPDDIPVLRTSPNELILDYRQLARFGVPDHRVPAQAILRGRPVTLYESYAPWFWAGGVIIALLSALSLLLGVNVIRRRHAERTVRARERQLQRVLDASPIGVAIVERARVVYLNAHFTRTFGYDLDIVPTMEAWWAVSVPDPEQRALVAQRWARAVERSRRAGNTLETLEGRIRRRDGELRSVRVASVSIDDRVVVVLDDVTDERRAADRRADRQRMEAIGNLAGGIAHDFNNILTPILGFIELAESEVDEQTELADYLTQVRRAGHRAQALVRQILTFSRRSPGQRELTPVASVVEEALGLIRASLPATVTIESELRSRAIAKVDVTQLHQVIMNLCTNAARAMGREAGTLTVTLYDEAECVCLTVEDTGHGIEPEELPRIFEPFYTTRAQGEGTGMGLAVVHGVVEQHNGRIAVESVLGQGTTFKVWLPAVTEADVVITEPPSTTPEIGPATVLFADDEAPLRELMMRVCKRAGVRLLCAENGREALELFAAHADEIDALITDVMMPEVPGDALVEAIRQTHPQLPVVMCTGRLESLEEAWITRYQPQVVLEKPILPSKLLETIEAAIAPPLDMQPGLPAEVPSGAEPTEAPPPAP